MNATLNAPATSPTPAEEKAERARLAKVAKAAASATSAATSKEAKARKKAEKDALNTSTLAKEIIAAAVGIGLGKTFGTNPNRPSCTIRIPSWDTFKAQLAFWETDEEDKQAIAHTFSALRQLVVNLVGAGAHTWVIHTSGSFGLYGKLLG